MRKEAEDQPSPRQKAAAYQRIGIKVTVRRVRIKPDEKREEYVRRLEKVIRFCEGVVNNPSAAEIIQLMALDVIIRAIRMGYTIVKDVDVENLERYTEEIKAQLKESFGPNRS